MSGASAAGGGNGGGTAEGRSALLGAATLADRAISGICKLVVVATGIALTVILSVNVLARYVLASGSIKAFDELPERLFPWFIVAGIVLAAQGGGHMSVDSLLDRLGIRGKEILIHVVHAIVAGSYLFLAGEALKLADIAAIEKSPVLELPGSHGYWAIAAGCVLLAVVAIASSLRIRARGLEARYSLTYRDV
ncbi:TRAP transporter small permease [Prosthecomicrobium sp. N25]|uniref:TRAP transporter small permease n=1 Tax=Prosthecomicrobium sp. N25 TaxID=3129254 RepID=UPI0030781E26